MGKVRLFAVVFITILPVKAAFSDNGFSIRGGLIHDTPGQDTYREMKSGIGYVGSLGFDIRDRIGLEIGVLHSTHDYIFTIEGNAVREKSAEKNTVFFKARGIPLKLDKAELVAAFGPAFFDISGPELFDNQSGGLIYELETGFSGWGFVTSLDMRYFVSKGLALTFYISGNFVRYNKYTINSLNTGYDGRLPRGDSFTWGLTIFHRIGMP